MNEVEGQDKAEKEKEELDEEQFGICPYCGRKFHKRGLAAHMAACRSNPINLAKEERMADARSLPEALNFLKEEKRERDLLAPPLSEEERELQALRHEQRLAVESLEILLQAYSRFDPRIFFDLEGMKDLMGERAVELIQLHAFSMRFEQWKTLSQITSIVGQQMLNRAKAKGIQVKEPETPILDYLLKRYQRRVDEYLKESGGEL